MKKLKYLVLILMILVFLSGLGILLYPYIQGYLVDRQIERTAEEFLSRVETAPISPYPSESQLDQDTPSDSPEPTGPDTYTDLWRDMVDYNKEIYINGQKGLDCKLAYEGPSFILADYGLESEVFAVISIPALELEMPVFLGANYRHMADGAAILSQTSIPIGGKNTNCIIAGHRGWGGASYFRYVDKLQPGDEVIVPAYTYCASAIPFGDLGAHIVWADINKDTWTIDPDDIARKITPKTKAVVCVHLLGMPCDMKKIVPIARAHGLKVVEDCAQALDCRIDGQHVGTFGDFGCFSFHSAKTMTTLGEGGMFVCADDADAAAAPGIRHNGCCAYPADRERYWSPAMSCVDSFLDDRWPQNFCIGEAQCALGTEELKSVIANNNTLIEQDRTIREKLAGLPEISFSRCPENGRYVVHQYIMHYDGSACGKTRDDLLDLMTKKYGIRCIVQYYPLYRYPLFQRKGCGEFDCPVLDKWWDGSFSFPWWCGMDDTVIDTLCSSLISAVEELRG